MNVVDSAGWLEYFAKRANHAIMWTQDVDLARFSDVRYIRKQ